MPPKGEPLAPELVLTQSHPSPYSPVLLQFVLPACPHSTHLHARLRHGNTAVSFAVRFGLAQASPATARCGPARTRSTLFGGIRCITTCTVRACSVKLQLPPSLLEMTGFGFIEASALNDPGFERMSRRADLRIIVDVKKLREAGKQARASIPRCTSPMHIGIRLDLCVQPPTTSQRATRIPVDVTGAPPPPAGSWKGGNESGGSHVSAHRPGPRLLRLSEQGVTGLGTTVEPDSGVLTLQVYRHLGDPKTLLIRGEIPSDCIKCAPRSICGRRSACTVRRTYT